MKGHTAGLLLGILLAFAIVILLAVAYAWTFSQVLEAGYWATVTYGAEKFHLQLTEMAR